MFRPCWVVVALLAIAPAARPQDDAVKPVNLDKVNTEADEVDPFPQPDGFGLLFARKVGGRYAIFQSKRTPGAAAWGAGKALRDLGRKDADYRTPFQLKTTLYYATNEVPDEKFADMTNFDLFFRPADLAPLRVNALSEATDEVAPWITAGGKELYFSRKTEDGWTLFVAQGPTPGPIGKARPVGFPAGFRHATLSAGGLVMVLEGPLDDGRPGLFRSRRPKVGAAWAEPEPLTALNHPDAKRGTLAPALSADGARLYFASDRPGGKGGLDLWGVPAAALLK